MKELVIKDEYIKLGQALKLAGLVESGVDAKYIISDGLVIVNDEVCVQRGRKLYNEDIFEFEGNKIKVISKI